MFFGKKLYIYIYIYIYIQLFRHNTLFFSKLWLSRYAHANQHKQLRMLMPSNIEILKIRPLTPYKQPFNPINRLWDPSRSIELEKCFKMMVLRAYQHLSDAHFMPKQAKDKVFLGSGLAWPGLAWPGLVWVGAAPAAV